MYLVELADAPIALEALAGKVRASSNFSFASIFYLYEDANPTTPRGALAVFDAILETPELDRVLRNSWVRDYRSTFELDRREKHALLVPVEGRLENVLASAAHDHAGAYSRVLRDATSSERAEVAELFGSMGRYQCFELVARPEPGCSTCGYRSEFFSNWFYGTAWDWCFFVVWEEKKVVGLICLTDTD